MPHLHLLHLFTRMVVEMLHVGMALGSSPRVYCSLCIGTVSLEILGHAQVRDCCVWAVDLLCDTTASVMTGRCRS
ncbi:hypothetical protein F4819DRAFT_478451 [Hypoxylon fuscum]|nr:hypothetical protein F4819DRAFT_478451 [Hypoxylon fuscum]